MLGGLQVVGVYYTQVKNKLTNYNNKSKLPKSNITKDEREALHSLKKDSNHMVLTADKWVALVVMAKDTYIEKCMTLLGDHGVCQECRDLTKTSITRSSNSSLAKK